MTGFSSFAFIPRTIKNVPPSELISRNAKRHHVTHKKNVLSWLSLVEKIVKMKNLLPKPVLFTEPQKKTSTHVTKFKF